MCGVINYVRLSHSQLRTVKRNIAARDGRVSNYFFSCFRLIHSLPKLSLIYSVLNVLQIIVEIVIVIIKFWIAVAKEVYTAFSAEERSVADDIVLITGAGHGIGKEMALQYSALGATVVCWDINEKLNQETVNLLKSKGNKKAFGYT